MKPLLRPHYKVRLDPPDSSGEEALAFFGESGRVVVKGRNFREFLNQVVPLLDGSHDVGEIHAAVSDDFALADLESALHLLESQGVVEDAERYPFQPAAVRYALPQIGYLRQTHAEPVQAMQALAGATVVVAGLGAVGSSVALSLAASRVGTLRCLDAGHVHDADPFLTQYYAQGEIGRKRVDVIRDRAQALNPDCNVETFGYEIEVDDDLAAVVNGADFVLSAADGDMISLNYKLNRVCAAQGIPWSSARANGFEGIVGPTVLPGRTACFVCTTMRTVACSNNPEEALRQVRYLDRRRLDDCDTRENLAFGSGITGLLLAQEAFRYLVSGQTNLAGRLLIFDFEESTSEKHRVLRVPKCPVCGIDPETAR